MNGWLSFDDHVLFFPSSSSLYILLSSTWSAFLPLFFHSMEATAQPTAFAVQNDTRPVLIIIVSIMLILVSLIGISLRIYSRLAILRKLFADDGTNMSLPYLTYLVAYRYLYLT